MPGIARGLQKGQETMLNKLMLTLFLGLVMSGPAAPTTEFQQNFGVQ
jgi:hypothetical protein